jgi:hypothetical protein
MQEAALIMGLISWLDKFNKNLKKSENLRKSYKEASSMVGRPEDQFWWRTLAVMMVFVCNFCMAHGRAAEVAARSLGHAK